VIRNCDLAFPLVMGLEFLTLSGVKLDFAITLCKFPEDEELHYFTNPGDLKPAITSSSSTRLHVELPTRPLTDTSQAMLKELVNVAEASMSQKRQLEQLLLDWPTVCTDLLGCTSIVTHQINIKDEVPVRKRAYPIPIHKQKFVDDEVAKMLEKGIIRHFNSPWAYTSASII